MNKKKTSNSSSSTKKSSAKTSSTGKKSTTKVSRTKKEADKSKAPAKKTKAKSAETKTATKTRKAGVKVEKQNKTVKSSSRDSERKLKEIASKTKLNTTKEKKETKGFSLDDVRLILKGKAQKTPRKSKDKTVQEPKTKVTSEKSKAPQKRVSKIKKIQTASVDDILGFGVASVSSRPIRDSKKVPKEWIPYYENLMSLRANLKGTLGERSQETLGSSAREASGELSLNSSDAGTDTFNQDVALSMVANEQEALEEIEDAIDRIFDGTFGVCQETQKPIKKARLKVVPFTRFSLEGQNLHEKRKHKETDTGAGTFATIADSTMGMDE